MAVTWHSDAPTSQKAVFVAGFTSGTATFITAIWCCITIFSTKKLRKPLWLFRASLCIKDVALCLVVLLPNIGILPTQTTNEVKLYNCYIAGTIIASVSASIFTLLCSSIDRYHAATRPFRYHMGELMPTGMALTLIFNCWMIGIIAAICVVTDYSRPNRYGYGVLLQFVPLESWQKALLLAGVMLVYCVSAWLLASSLSNVAQQKRESRLRLESGQEEPIRSRRNSFSDDRYSELPPNKTTSRPPVSDSESDANQLFLQIEDPGIAVPKKTKRKWSLTLTQKASFFTPTSYRPSILRRIRDTWYLYVVVVNCGVSLLTTVLPFCYLIIAGEHCKDIWSATELFHGNTTWSTYSGLKSGDISLTPVSSNLHCVLSSICDCLILSQGFICVLIYVFADDVFRPIFLWPVVILLIPFQQCCSRRGGSESTYSAGRRRTLSRNSNAISAGM